MVRGGNWKKIDRSLWKGRYAQGRAFLRAARESLDMAEEGQSGNPIMSNAVLALIAYADALSIRLGGIQNAKGHATLPQTLKQAMGERAEKGQLDRLQRLIGQKGRIHYDFRMASIDEARRYTAQVERFAEWAEGFLQ